MFRGHFPREFCGKGARVCWNELPPQNTRFKLLEFY